MTTAVDSVQNLSKDNFEIAVKSFGAISKGVQTVASEIGDYNKASFERGTAYLHDLAGAKDIGQALEIHTNFWKSSYEDFASEMSKLGEIWAGIALNATKPQDAHNRKAKAQ